jgi:hypothetical protein
MYHKLHYLSRCYILQRIIYIHCLNWSSGHHRHTYLFCWVPSGCYYRILCTRLHLGNRCSQQLYLSSTYMFY